MITQNTMRIKWSQCGIAVFGLIAAAFFIAARGQNVTFYILTCIGGKNQKYLNYNIIIVFLKL